MLSNKEKPIFNNLVEQDSGLVTAGNFMGNNNNLSEEECLTDLYKASFGVTKTKALLEHGVEEYNKSYPRIKLALYRVRKLI